MNDLIERLRALSRYEHSDYSIGDEAADALEAAREDAERYRWLRKGVHDDIAVVRGLGAMDSVGGEANTYSKEIDGDDLDAAIDQARGKAGREVDYGQ
jgi:hypothetical protein